MAGREISQFQRLIYCVVTVAKAELTGRSDVVFVYECGNADKGDGTKKHPGWASHNGDALEEHQASQKPIDDGQSKQTCRCLSVEQPGEAYQNHADDSDNVHGQEHSVWYPALFGF